MAKKIAEVAARIAQLEQKLERARAEELEKKCGEKMKSLSVAQMTYSLIVHLALMDLWIWLYQALCFSVEEPVRVIKVENFRRIQLSQDEGSPCDQGRNLAKHGFLIARTGSQVLKIALAR